MAFIEYEQAETVAPALHVDVRRVVGRHCQRLKVVVSAAQQTDLAAKRDRQFAVPLVEQVNSWRHDKRRPGGAMDGEDGDVCLPRPGRQYDHAAAALLDPRLKSLGLVRKWIAASAQRPRRRPKSSRFVLVFNVIPPQMLDYGTILAGLGPVRIRARIVADAGESEQLFRRSAGDNNGAGVECQEYSRLIHTVHIITI